MVGDPKKKPAWAWTESFVGIGFILLLFIVGGLLTAFVMFVMWALFSWRFDGNLNFTKQKGKTTIDKFIK